ncbi:MAG TPA: serine hydrolase domain-containing protein [Candidatus Limnocylindrales bacterium]
MFERVAEEFANNFASRGEVGAAFAAVRGGELVVDLWGGIADPATGRPWERDTMQLALSGAKGLVSACVLLLIQRNAIELEAPVARYWPEFAGNGKSHVTVAQVMSHQARLPGIARPVPRQQAIDPILMAQQLAEQAPETDPRAEFVYHGLTFGWLAAEIIRRVDGRDVGTLFAQEFAGPLGLDLWLGVPPEHHDRIAAVHFAPDWPAQGPPEGDKLLESFVIPRIGHEERPVHLNSAAFRSSLSPANGAIGTARSFALFYGRLGEILRPEIVELGRTALRTGRNTLDGQPMSIGVGFQLETGDPVLPDWFGHNGLGGSTHGMWPSRDTAFSYLPNCLALDRREKCCRPLLVALN